MKCQHEVAIKKNGISFEFPPTNKSGRDDDYGQRFFFATFAISAIFSESLCDMYSTRIVSSAHANENL